MEPYAGAGPGPERVMPPSSGGSVNKYYETAPSILDNVLSASKSNQPNAPKLNERMKEYIARSENDHDAGRMLRQLERDYKIQSAKLVTQGDVSYQQKFELGNFFINRMSKIWKNRSTTLFAQEVIAHGLSILSSTPEAILDDIHRVSGYLGSWYIESLPKLEPKELVQNIKNVLNQIDQLDCKPEIKRHFMSGITNVLMSPFSSGANQGELNLNTKVDILLVYPTSPKEIVSYCYGTGAVSIWEEGGIEALQSHPFCIRHPRSMDIFNMLEMLTNEPSR